MINLNHQQSYGIAKWLFRTYPHTKLSFSQLTKKGPWGHMFELDYDYLKLSANLLGNHRLWLTGCSLCEKVFGKTFVWKEYYFGMEIPTPHIVIPHYTNK